MASKKNPRIKRAHEIVETTPEQAFELLKCAEDPVYFIENYVRVQHPTKGSIPLKLYDYQKKMLRMYQQERYTIVLSARQTGKEQPHSAKIATPAGWTTMGQISKGDEVLTPDGQTAIVLDKFPQGIKDVYRITFDDGSSVEAGLEHLWKCYIRNKWDSNAANGHGGYVVEEYVKTTAELIEHFEHNKTRKNSRNYNIRIPVVQRVNFNEKDLPLDPYTLGLLLGDGSLSQPSTVLFTTKDPCLVESIQAATEPLGSTIRLRESGNGLDYSITSKHRNNKNPVMRILQELGLQRTKSETKFIPEQYLTASHEQRLALLQGLMDTDGTVSKRKDTRTISYCTTSLRLRDDVQQLVWSLGGRCSYYIRKPQNPDHKVAYDLYISLPNPKDCFKLERKRKLCHGVWRNNVGYETDIRRTVVNIEKIRQEESSCIMIDHPDHLYITDNFTVTHNSTVSAIYLLWFAMFHEDKTILIASNKNSGAMEMIHRIRFAYEELPRWLKPGVSDDGWNKHSVAFDNLSRIISTATSEDSGRGLSISLLFLDEFAFVAPNIQEEFWTSISPTLSTGGSCIITSTPNGDANRFARMWRAAKVGATLQSDTNELGFKPLEVKWDEPPGRDDRFKQEQIAILGEHKWKQEYECEFLSSDALLIDSGVLQELTKHIEVAPEPKTTNDFSFWQPIKEGDTYLLGVDPSTGSGSDFSVIQLFHFPSMVQVAEYRSNTMSSPDLYRKLKWLITMLEKVGCTCYFSIENNGVGEGLIALYMNDETPPQFAEFVSDGGTRMGMNTNGRTKNKACVGLKDMIEKNKLSIKSMVLLTELKSFVRRRESYAAQDGSTDDAVSAVLIVIRILEQIAAYEQDAFDKLYSYDDNDFNAGVDTDMLEDDPLPIIF